MINDQAWAAQRDAPWAAVTKRALDIVLGTLLALLALPIIVVLAVAVAASLRCWPFFAQRRVGRHGRQFWMVKLRTLPPSAPRAASKYAIRDIDVPWIPRMLRTHHLDELPQLFLVPFGRMSLVGPRPEMPSLHTNLPAEFAVARTSLRPGCTGLWQVSVAHDRLICESTVYDDAYLTNRSLVLDAWILAITPFVMTGLRAPLGQDDLAGLGLRSGKAGPPSASRGGGNDR